MAMLVAFCTACASSWKKNQASKNVVLEAMNRQVNALSKWRTRDFLELGMGVIIFEVLFVRMLTVDKTNLGSKVNRLARPLRAEEDCFGH